MALITETTLETSGSHSSQSSYTTSGLTFSPLHPILVAVTSQYQPGNPNVPTPSMTGWVFSQVTNVIFYSSTGRITLFTGIGTGNGSITFDFAGQSQSLCCWSVSQYKNTKVTGTGGSNVVVQSTTTSANSNGTSYSVTLGAFSDIRNATYATVAKNAINSVVPGSGFTDLGQFNTTGSPNWCIESNWRNNNSTNPTGVFAGSGGDSYGAIAVEIAFKSDPSGGGILPIIM